LSRAKKAAKEAPKVKEAPKAKEAAPKAKGAAKEAPKTKEGAKEAPKKKEAPKTAKPKVAKSGAEPSLKKSRSLISKIHKRNRGHKIDLALEDQFTTGRLLACISSRPGQSGRCDGYILEGKELEFYTKKIQKKKTAHKA